MFKGNHWKTQSLKLFTVVTSGSKLIDGKIEQRLSLFIHKPLCAICSLNHAYVLFWSTIYFIKKKQTHSISLAKCNQRHGYILFVPCHLFPTVPCVSLLRRLICRASVNRLSCPQAGGDPEGRKARAECLFGGFPQQVHHNGYGMQLNAAAPLKGTGSPQKLFISYL